MQEEHGSPAGHPARLVDGDRESRADARYADGKRWQPAPGQAEFAPAPPAETFGQVRVRTALRAAKRAATPLLIATAEEPPRTPSADGRGSSGWPSGQGSDLQDLGPRSPGRARAHPSDHSDQDGQAATRPLAFTCRFWTGSLGETQPLRRCSGQWQLFCLARPALLGSARTAFLDRP